MFRELIEFLTNKKDKVGRPEEIAEKLKATGVVTPEKVIIPEIDDVNPLWSAFAKLKPNTKSHWAYYGQTRQRPDLDAVEKFAGYRPKLKEMMMSWQAYKSR